MNLLLITKFIFKQSIEHKIHISRLFDKMSAVIKEALSDCVRNELLHTLNGSLSVVNCDNNMISNNTDDDEIP